MDHVTHISGQHTYSSTLYIVYLLASMALRILPSFSSLSTKPSPPYNATITNDSTVQRVITLKCNRGYMLHFSLH